MTAVVADDPVADREAQPGPAAHRLGREEGLEDVRQVLGTDPAAVVLDLHEDGGLAVGPGAHSIGPSRSEAWMAFCRMLRKTWLILPGWQATGGSSRKPVSTRIAF